MKKFFVSLLLSLPLVVVTAQSESSYGDYWDLGCESIPDCVELLINAALKLALPIAVIFIIWSGFLFVFARGSEDGLKKARATLQWSIIGLAITIAAWTLAVAFKNFFLSL